MHMKTNKTQTHKCKFINKLYNNYTYIYIYTECIQRFLYLHIAGHPGHAKHEIRHLAGRPHLQCPAMSTGADFTNCPNLENGTLLAI